MISHAGFSTNENLFFQYIINRSQRISATDFFLNLFPVTIPIRLSTAKRIVYTSREKTKEEQNRMIRQGVYSAL